MSTAISELPDLSLRPFAVRHERRSGAFLAALLTLLALVIHGYHPYTEDGGVYLAGVEKLLHPELFPRSADFVLAPTRFSAFAPFLSGIARLTHLTRGTAFDALIFSLYVATVWTTLYTAFRLASRCWTTPEARAGALLLLACWLALPVAGTSLLFMDPYLTARSFSTPCVIAALTGILDATAPRDPLRPASPRGGLYLAAASLAFAALLHPLMAVYGVMATLLVTAFRLPTRRTRLTMASLTCALFFAAYTAVSRLSPPEPPHYAAIALTRTYWFLSEWRWFECAGIVAPAAILLVFALSHDPPEAATGPARTSPARALAAGAVTCALLVTGTALVFGQPGASTYRVAALQPLRGLQFVYLVMILTLGATLGAKLLRRNRLAWIGATAVLAGPLLAAAETTTFNSGHLELPGLDIPQPLGPGLPMGTRQYAPGRTLRPPPRLHLPAQRRRAVLSRHSPPQCAGRQFQGRRRGRSLPRSYTGLDRSPKRPGPAFHRIRRPPRRPSSATGSELAHPACPRGNQFRLPLRQRGRKDLPPALSRPRRRALGSAARPPLYRGYEGSCPGSPFLFKSAEAPQLLGRTAPFAMTRLRRNGTLFGADFVFAQRRKLLQRNTFPRRPATHHLTSCLRTDYIRITERLMIIHIGQTSTLELPSNSGRVCLAPNVHVYGTIG